MYLKSIEVQGFKSFANKIIFDFHNGITGIVGPNGSGKSNVADAVRWVLGEQSAKQLRGSKMEDVIFAGTQNRKPVGFAYVAITLDNSDHALPVDYNEVTVSRRVFRSGESEYKINGHSCRLKDVTELFYDTGIGKEGYSIIGQGQIDKILSGKPEERRELFDEAAGIVKFKRRKLSAQKKLESERNNLVRVNDILSELEKQVEPLERQSQKAKEYLKLKDDLKLYDVNAFLLETDKLKGDIKAIDDKLLIAQSDLDNAKKAYESTKAEYEAAEEQLNDISNNIDMVSSLLSNTELDKQKLEGSINVYNEQIKTIEANDTHYSTRINAITSELSQKNSSMKELVASKKDITSKLKEYTDKQQKAQEVQSQISQEIISITSDIEKRQNDIYDILNEKSVIKADNQKYKTMLEQFNIRKAEFSSKIIQGKSEEKLQDTVIQKYQEDFEQVVAHIKSITSQISDYNDSITKLKENIAQLSADADKQQQQYHREKSRLESLVNITERYDGYGSSIRKIMELKDDNEGILGVIADIIKVEKKYETAIETALGGTIQNIVTDNEDTAKGLIKYLKENKFGRATFLPLSSLQVRNTLENDPCIKENGVVGVASSLVRVSFEYEKLAKYLLGRILVVDNIDNALLIAKKYKYSLRIVTLEGEQLNPGGSMTGGAFKNSSNLLGRRREIEELKKEVNELSKSGNLIKANISENRKEVSELRSKLDEANKQLRDEQIKKNTAQLNFNQAVSKKKEIINSYSDYTAGVKDLEIKINQITESLNNVSGNLTSLDTRNEISQKEIDELNAKLEEKKKQESTHLMQVENAKIQYTSAKQQQEFIEQNISRIESEINSLNEEASQININMSQTDKDIASKKLEIEKVKNQIEQAVIQLNGCTAKIAGLKEQKKEVNDSHKTFFEKREKINREISSLDKECYRLIAQKEKLEETNDTLVNYIWNEYELTYSYAIELKNDGLNNLSDLKKKIYQLKSSIKNLGDVNVNAIEEYKEVSERYTFLKTQHDDLIQAEASLIQIIDELDKGMRVQFEQKFEEIRVEFDKVFKELFGGGRGTIQLVEGEDILEAGIIIISQPPGKKLQNMMQLSGGEKALTAIALLFAIQNLKPSPFCLLDEIEAALDDSNVGRYANYLHKLTKHTQFIVITHRRGTMTAADRLYGITMQEKGVSALVSVDLIENDLERAEKLLN